MKPHSAPQKTSTRGIYFLSPLLVMVLLTSMGLGPRKAKKEANPDSELAKAPVAARGWRNPYEGQPDALLAGKKLFKRHCADCHGSLGEGEGKAPDLGSSEIQSLPPGVLFWFLKNGNLKEGMPSWSGLPDQQRWQLVTYLKSLK